MRSDEDLAALRGFITGEKLDDLDGSAADAEEVNAFDWNAVNWEADDPFAKCCTSTFSVISDDGERRALKVLKKLFEELLSMLKAAEGACATAAVDAACLTGAGQ